MNLDHDFFHVSKLSEDQKKEKVFTKLSKVFSSNSSEDQKKVFVKLSRVFSSNSSDSHADHSEIIGRDTDVDLSQIIGRDAVKLLGGIYPPISPGFGTPAYLLYYFI